MLRLTFNLEFFCWKNIWISDLMFDRSETERSVSYANWLKYIIQSS